MVDLVCPYFFKSRVDEDNDDLLNLFTDDSIEGKNVSKLIFRFSIHILSATHTRDILHRFS